MRLGRAGIGVVDSEKTFREDKLLDRTGEGAEEIELDLTPGALDKTNDPVRMYLREMGTVPLLTREGEVEIAKRIERGKKAVLKVIARTPMAAQEVARLGERLSAGEISVRDAVVFNEDELTEDKLENKVKETLRLIEDVAQAHRDYLGYRKRFVEIAQRRPRYVKGKGKLGRLRIGVSRAIRVIEFSEAVKRRLTERIRESVERIREAEDRSARLEPKLRSKVSDDDKQMRRKQRPRERE